MTAMDGSSHLENRPAAQPETFLDRLLIKPAAILGFHLLEKVRIQSGVQQHKCERMCNSSHSFGRISIALC